MSGRMALLAAVLWVAGGQAQEAAAQDQREMFVGTDVCLECHEDKLETLQLTKHGQTADERTLLAQKGCESCHQAGEVHAFSEGE